MRARGWAIGVALLLGLVAAGWWALDHAAPPAPDPAEPALVTAPGEVPFVATEHVAIDAGVGRVAGQVLRGDGLPAVDAEVLIFDAPDPLEELECGVCHKKLLECDDPGTVRRVLAGLRDGSLRRGPPALATRTDAKGEFVFEVAPFQRELVVRHAAGVAHGLTVEGQEALVFELEPRLSETLSVASSLGEPLAGVTVTAWGPADGRLVTMTSDSTGHVLFEGLEPWAWVAGERAGLLPTAEVLFGDSTLHLSPPVALTVRTQLGGQPIDAELTAELHLPGPLKTTGGVLRLENLRAGTLICSASAPGYQAAEQVAELEGPETELVFELRRGATLLVSTVTEAGEPLDEVGASLDGSEASARDSAEQGALLTLGPLPEGEYQLTVTSPGMVSASRTVDLGAGETQLEVVLRKAPVLTGRVVDAAGKPVEGARIAVLDGETELATELTGEPGEFRLELEFPGQVTVRAHSALLGAAEGQATVPGDVTLTLRPRATLEVVVFDADGKPLEPDLMVRRGSAVVGWLEVTGDPANGQAQVGRLAGLEPGTYRLEREIPGRVPLEEQVTLADGEVRRLTLRVEAGVTVSGKVVDAEGRPARADCAVRAVERVERVETDEQGRFEWKGLKPGEVRLYAGYDGAESSDVVTVTAPAKDVVLTLPRLHPVTGRVVDERGAPLKQFELNGLPAGSPDGRFRIELADESLEVTAPGREAKLLEEPKGELGDVPLRPQQLVEGEVVDGAGKPVGGAVVTAVNDGLSVTTDAAGRFKLALAKTEDEELVATRGALSGRVPARSGGGLRIELRRGTEVTGTVLDRAGRPVPSVVTASDGASRQRQIDTDGSGRFSLVLPAGVWLFSTRNNRVARAVEIGGERVQLTLGDDPSTCGFTVSAPGTISGLWLLSQPLKEDQLPWERAAATPGSAEVPVTGSSPSVTVRGVPCGALTLTVLWEGRVSTQVVSLRGLDSVLTIAPEPEAIEQEDVGAQVRPLPDAP